RGPLYARHKHRTAADRYDWPAACRRNIAPHARSPRRYGVLVEVVDHNVVNHCRRHSGEQHPVPDPINPPQLVIADHDHLIRTYPDALPRGAALRDPAEDVGDGIDV